MKIRYKLLKSLPLFLRVEPLERPSNNCNNCPRNNECGPQVGSEGSVNSPFIFVGREAGEEEVKNRRPFYPKAPGGRFFTEYLNALELKREQVYITNVLNCRGNNNRPPEPEEVALCMPHRHFEFLQLTGLRFVFPLGTHAFQLVTGIYSSVTPHLGICYYMLYKGRRIYIFPLHHPGYLCRRPSERETVFKLLEEIRIFIQRKNQTFNSLSESLV